MDRERVGERAICCGLIWAGLMISACGGATEYHAPTAERASPSDGDGRGPAHADEDAGRAPSPEEVEGGRDGCEVAAEYDPIHAMELYRSCLDGMITWEVSTWDNAGHTVHTRIFRAEMFRSASDAVYTSEREILDPYEGIDDCVVFTDNGRASRSEPEVVGWERLEHAVVELVGESLTLEEFYGGETSARETPVRELWYYTAEGEAVADAAAWEGSARVTLERLDGQVLTLDGITLPPRVELLAPALGEGVTLHAEAQTFRWTGTTSGTATVFLSVIDSISESHRVVCIVEDDGSFTVPGSVMALLPARRYIQAGVWRWQERNLTVGDLRFRVATTTGDSDRARWAP